MDNRYDNVDPAFKTAILETATEEIGKATTGAYRESVIKALQVTMGLTGSIAISFVIPPAGLMLSALAGLTALALPLDIRRNIQQAGKEAVQKMTTVLTKMNATTDKLEQKSIMLEAYPALFARFPRETTQARVADVLPSRAGGGSSSTMARVYAGAATHRDEPTRQAEPLNWQQWQEETRKIIKEKKAFDPTLTRE
jgi:hypothetical protein